MGPSPTKNIPFCLLLLLSLTLAALNPNFTFYDDDDGLSVFLCVCVGFDALGGEQGEMLH